MHRPVVILIFTHKPDLAWHEKISLEQCCRILGGYPVFLVCPSAMDVSQYRRLAPGLQVDYIDPGHLSSLRNYNRLKMQPFLYDRYKNYEFMLTYELDAFVLRDELRAWCDAGWDYIGAPWFDGWAEAKPAAEYLGVGNSGFSLRRVSSARRVHRSRKPIQRPAQIWNRWRENGRWRPGSLLLLLSWLTWRNNFYTLYRDFHGNEDVFWGTKVPAHFPWFRVAPVEEARKFSFECNPARLLKEAGGLPFGCHKWSESNLTFWKPIVESFGYAVSEARPR